MTHEESVRRRIAAQFSYLGDRADIWRGLELFLDTDAYLNLGYSRWYQPHALGSPQGRLAARVGRSLAARLPDGGTGERVLDVGCGRGGPAAVLADRYGWRILGVDLVAYNARRARRTAADRGVGRATSFCVGDATALPVGSGAVAGAVAVDAFVYLPDRAAAIEELGRVLEPGGAAVISDLVAADEDEGGAVEAFATAWDMERPGTVAEYRSMIEAAGLEVQTVADLTGHSVGRFRRWSGLYLRLLASPVGELVERALAARGLDPAAVTAQIRRAHAALPALGHVLFVLEAPRKGLYRR